MTLKLIEVLNISGIIKSKIEPENALNFQQLLNLMGTMQQLSKWDIRLWKEIFGA